MAFLGLTNQQLLIGGAAVVAGVFILPSLFGGGGGIGGRGTRIVMLNQRDRQGMGRQPQMASPNIRAPLIQVGYTGAGHRNGGGSDRGVPAPGNGGGGDGGNNKNPGGGSDPEKKPPGNEGNEGGDKPRPSTIPMGDGGRMGEKRQQRWNQQIRRAEQVAERQANTRNDDVYTVKPGDTMWGIANQQFGAGARWRDVWRANKDQLNNPTMFNNDPGTIFQKIRPGQKLRIPR